MLYEVLRYIRNFYVAERYSGYFTIEENKLMLPIRVKQYFLIEGSVFNDGVHTSGDVLEDEEFNGHVALLAIPKELLDLVAEIEQWQEKNAEAVESPYQSESFGGYSYTKTGGVTGSSVRNGWQRAFANRLEAYKKL